MATYLSGDKRLRPYPVKTGVAIAKGDHLYCDQTDGFCVKPASSFTWNSSLAQTQTDFNLRFAGIADETYAGTSFTAPNNPEYGLQLGEIMVCQGGVFEETCASATFYPGTLIGIAKASGNALEAQKVVQTSTEVTSIGRVHQKASSTTKVRYSIYPELDAITTSAAAGS